MPSDPIDARCFHCGELPPRCECVMNNPSVLSRDALLIRAQCTRTVLATVTAERDEARRELARLECANVKLRSVAGALFALHAPYVKPHHRNLLSIWIQTKIRDRRACAQIADADKAGEET